MSLNDEKYTRTKLKEELLIKIIKNHFKYIYRSVEHVINRNTSNRFSQYAQDIFIDYRDISYLIGLFYSRQEQSKLPKNTINDLNKIRVYQQSVNLKEEKISKYLTRVCTRVDKSNPLSIYIPDSVCSLVRPILLEYIHSKDIPYFGFPLFDSYVESNRNFINRTVLEGILLEDSHLFSN